MLASLERIPGVREARVHHDGVYFLFAIDAEAEASDVLEGARELLPDAARPPAEVEAKLVEGYRRGETWLRSADTKELSREEAHLLAKRHAEHAATVLALDEARKAKLARVLDEETVAAFDRIHAAGGGLGETSQKEFVEGARRAVERSREFLDAAQSAKLEELLESWLGR